MTNVVFGEQKMFPVFMPSLLTRFREAEEQSGTPLTQIEATQIRDRAVGVLVREEIASKLEQRRGFRDLHPDEFWSDWQRMRSDARAAPST